VLGTHLGQPSIRRPDGRHPLIGAPLPDFQLPDMRTGRLRTKAEFIGKRYILNFFASW
jgi:peroxiredoxin